MSRRAIYIGAFLLFVPLVVWYASGFAGVPEVTFSRATQIADSADNSKVLVAGYVVEEEPVAAEGSTLTFYLTDADGVVSKVLYDGTSPIPAEQLEKAKGEKRVVSVAGHACGDKFHAKDVIFND